MIELDQSSFISVALALLISVTALPKMIAIEECPWASNFACGGTAPVGVSQLAGDGASHRWMELDGFGRPCAARRAAGQPWAFVGAGVLIFLPDPGSVYRGKHSETKNKEDRYY